MFAPFLNWFLGGGHCSLTLGGLEPFSTKVVESGWGEEILSAVPRRRELLREVEDLLIGFPREDRPGLVSRTALRFALYAVDLPASEQHHDSGPFGLLDHSLEVARKAVGELVRPSFRVSEDPAANYREQPVWAYAGFVLGLFHDVGKMLDVEVQGWAGTTWNPFGEPLAAFLKRSGMSSSGPGSVKWVKGRGLQAHVWRAQALVPRILPPQATLLLGSRLPELLAAFTRSYTADRKEWTKGPAGRVVDAVRRLDQELSKAANAARAAAESPGEPEAAVAVSPAEVSDPSPDPSFCETNPERPVPSGGERQRPASPEAGRDPKEVPGQLSPKAPHNLGKDEQEGEEDPDDKGSQKLLFPEPVGRNRKIDCELEPKRLLQNIKEAVRSANVQANSAHAEAFICQEYIWLQYPQALTSILRGVGVHWTTGIADRVLATLLKDPQLAPQNPRYALVHARLLPRGKDPIPFLRFRTQGFLPDRELADLGLWPHEIKVVDVALVSKAG